MPARYVAYALAVNLLPLAVGIWYALYRPNSLGFAVFYIFGVVWWCATLFCGFLFLLGSGASQWRFLLHGSGAVVLLLCVVFAANALMPILIMQTALLVFPLGISGCLTGMLVEKIIWATRYMRKNRHVLHFFV